MKGYGSFLLGALLLSPTLLHSADPFLEKWYLDTRRSKYQTSSCPKQMSIEMTPVDGAVHYHSETQLENGTSFSADYIANYDDVPTMVTDAKGVLLPASLHKEGANVIVATYRSGLETRATSRRIVSADGNTMTVTTTSRDGLGNVQTNIGVYTRSSSFVGGLRSFTSQKRSSASKVAWDL